MRSVFTALLACSTFVLSSCVAGSIYTHTVEPLTTNFHNTPVVDDAAGEGDVKQIDYYVRVSWSANAIGEIAKANGFDEVHYADLETLSVLGLWTQRWAHVYGTRKAP